MLFGAFQSHVSRLISTGALSGGSVVWPLWDAYLSDPSGQRLIKGLSGARVPLAFGQHWRSAAMWAHLRKRGGYRWLTFR